MRDARSRLVGILVAHSRGAPMRRLSEVHAEAGRGLQGDRYHQGIGTFSRRMEIAPGARALSVIDTSAIALCNRRLGLQLTASDLRRNLVIDSLDLARHRSAVLAIGDVRIELVARCPPCRYLSRLVAADMRRGLYGSGGMRARILSSGRLQTGMPVRICSTRP